MVNYRRKRKYNHSLKKKSSGSSRRGKKLILIGLISVGVYILYDKQNNERQSEMDMFDEKDSALTLDEKVKQKVRDLELQKHIKSQENLSEKFKKPVGKIDVFEPEISNLDMGVSFPESAPIKEVAEELAEKPFQNDIYEDPENVIRRQLAHNEWLEKHLKERNQKEREEFLKKFVQSAREQGYNVYFTKDMKAILEPIDPEEEKKKKGDFEEVKINWK